MLEENVKCCASLYYSYPLIDRKDTPVWRKEGKKLVCLLSTVKKTISVLEYQGTRNPQESTDLLTLLKTTISERV
jgi:hypothetical protein